MSKGTRNRAKNAEENQKKKVDEEKSIAKKKLQKLAAIIVSAVLVVAIGVSVSVNAFYFGNGEYLRKTTVSESKTQKVDNAMMLYFFNQSFNNYKNYYGDYFEAFTGIDLKKSLKTQDYTDGQTWFDFIKTSSEDAVTELMVLADTAAEKGFTLSDEEKQSISDRAEKADLTAFNGKLSKDDYKRCLELTATATLYKNSILNGYTYTEDEVSTYYQENSKSFENVSYRKYSVPFSDEEGSTAFTSAYAKAKADELKAADSEEKFTELAKGLIKESNKEITDADLETKATATLSENVAYITGDEVSDWAFSADRKVGDTYLYAPENTNNYSVYYLTALPKRVEDATVSAGHILFTTDAYGSDEAAKAKAEEVLAMYQGGDKSLESFSKLAFMYTDDQGSTYTGGVYNNIQQGQMVAEFDSWIFDGARKAGDVEIVKTTFGYHIIYYVGQGLPVWQSQVTDTLKTNSYKTDYTALKESNPITFNEEKLQDIPM